MFGCTLWRSWRRCSDGVSWLLLCCALAFGSPGGIGCRPGGLGRTAPPLRVEKPTPINRALVAGPDGGTTVRWVLPGQLVRLGPAGRHVYRMRQDPSLRSARVGRVILINGRASGIDISGLESEAAVALLGRHRAVELVIWRDVTHLFPPVLEALASLSTKSLVLVLGQSLTAEGPMDLAPLGRLRATLYGLVLVDLELGAGSFAALRSLSGLRALHVAASLDRTAVAHLGGLSQVRQLGLHGALRAFGSGPAALREVGRLTGLEVLDLGGNQLDDESLVHLRRLRHLRWLDLGGNRLRGSGLGHLGQMARLRWLRLRRNPLVGTAVAPLSRLVGLRVLELSRTGVTNGGLARLAGLAGLKELHVQHTRVTWLGLDAFRRARPGCRVRIAAQAQPDPAPRARATGSQATGIAACDRYLQIMRCVMGTLKGSAQSAMRTVIQRSAEALRASLGQPGKSTTQRGALEQACRMSVTAYHRALKGRPAARCIR